MIQKKICMLGSYGVGKTSLVRRYVHSMFSEKYHSTIGVKIDKREIEVDGKEVRLLLWDVAGEEDNFKIPPSYLVGSAGNLLIIDGTRAWTAEKALDIEERIEKTTGKTPLVVLLNKIDLTEEWELEESALEPFREMGHSIIRTSAKTGEGVEEAFDQLTRAILGLS